jgi:uncharacterized protein YjeT (DUF2065 family)
MRLLSLSLVFVLTGCGQMVICYNKITGQVSQCSVNQLSTAGVCKTKNNITACYVN